MNNIPYEVLDCILKGDDLCESELRQFQLVNRLWRSVAEKYIYRTLNLLKSDDTKRELDSYEKALGPRRSKFVKKLQISKENVSFDNRFFKMFPNINTVLYYSRYDADWKYFKETFTSKRCKLIEIGELGFHIGTFQSKSSCQHFIDAISDHAQTLEVLDIPRAELSDFSIIGRINSLSLFPNIKRIVSRQIYDSLQDLDSTINASPKLNYLDVEIGREGVQIEKWLPKEQHQPNMKFVDVRCVYQDPSTICNYLVSKLPSVERWRLNFGKNLNDSRAVRIGFKIIASFEEMKNTLHLISKSREVTLVLSTYLVSVLDVIDLFTIAYQVQSWNATITYTEARKYFSPISKRTRTDIADLSLSCYSRPQVSCSNSFSIVYLPDALYHLEILEKWGHCIRKLEITIHQYRQVMVEGTLPHLLDACPMLSSLRYITESILVNIGPIASTPVHNNLKKVYLKCHNLNQETLLSLSNRAPNIKDLSIGGGREYDLAKKHKNITINMPQNSFNVLEVLRLRNREPFGCSKHIIYKFTLLATGSTQYYIRVYKPLLGEHSIDDCEEEKYQRLCDRPNCTNITVICKSIECFRYYHDEYSKENSKNVYFD